MSRNSTLIGIAALARAAGATPVLAGEDIPRGEAELAKLLEGRVAGEPQRCITSSTNRNVAVIDETALVFTIGSTIYVNRPANADLLDWNDIPVFELDGSQICRQDRVQLRDRQSLFPGPYLFLSDFVPYKKADEGSSQGDVQ